jgi:probable HAF family extracellular repeat protein
LYLAFALGINDVGEIVGLAVDNSGDTHAFLAAPIHSEADSEGFSPAERRMTSPRAVPDSARRLLGQRFGIVGR